MFWGNLGETTAMATYWKTNLVVPGSNHALPMCFSQSFLTKSITGGARTRCGRSMNSFVGNFSSSFYWALRAAFMYHPTENDQKSFSHIPFQSHKSNFWSANWLSISFHLSVVVVVVVACMLRLRPAPCLRAPPAIDFAKKTSRRTAEWSTAARPSFARWGGYF